MAFSFGGIFSAVQNFLGPLGKLWEKLKAIYDHTTNIYGAGEKLTQSIISEVNAWRNFKSDIRFKSRVVQLESAVTKTRDLIEGIPAAWKSIVDIFKQFKSQLGESNPVEEAEAATEEAEASGISGLLKSFPRLAQAFEKVLGVLAIVAQALDAIANTIDDVQTIVDEITRLRLEIEKLDTIFLSQSNKRKTLKLADGGSIQIRVGKLHPSA